MIQNEFYLQGFWRFQKTILFVSFLVMLAGMMTIDASLLPIHWNVYGQADRFANKYMVLGLWPILILALMLFMAVVPKLEKNKEKLKQSKKALSFILGGTTTLMFFIQLVSIFEAMDFIKSVPHWIIAFVSVFMLVMGNFLSKVQPNYTLGIRTKWTLADDQVWIKTHRFASLMFIFSGLLSISSLFWMPASLLFLNVVLFVLIALLCVYYSYKQYLNTL